jgi:hypothetical protein
VPMNRLAVAVAQSLVLVFSPPRRRWPTTRRRSRRT